MQWRESAFHCGIVEERLEAIAYLEDFEIRARHVVRFEIRVGWLAAARLGLLANEWSDEV